jgi:hypothetical protein
MLHHEKIPSSLTFDEKLVKLIEHWIRHNNDHAATYRDWARKAGENKHPEVAALLEEAAQMTMEISRRFESAAKQID